MVLPVSLQMLLFFAQKRQKTRNDKKILFNDNNYMQFFSYLCNLILGKYINNQ